MSSKSSREGNVPRAKGGSAGAAEDIRYSISAVVNAAVDPPHGPSHSTDSPWESLVALLRWVLREFSVSFWLLAIAS